MQKRINWLYLTLVFCLLCFSCDSKAVYDVYKPVPNSWNKDTVASFNFKAPDTINNYNVYVNLRNNSDYKFSNLFLIVELNYPNGKIIKDTLEYKMAAPNGELLGTGFSDVKENKLWYRGYSNDFKFTEEGEYTVNIQHAMRNNGEANGIVDLQGITDIGFRVEITQK
ncbi:gliding motility lipoprotein GldH [Winogradskyella sp. UBA3174]|uniref:gliding motility lipoprotein GldH n=1 Tax=Winogradskyella sp. UBA3174 TaxID=1947785 RepID=UPI0025F152F7|nr:gliding motility lipoprotein GldH [Winogradskyella sp. UBA3174]|tara:strand:+ start:22446 stop:22949 length:504 start_codon:yes stop_codon:yes gene_type:complete